MGLSPATWRTPSPPGPRGRRPSPPPEDRAAARRRDTTAGPWPRAPPGAATGRVPRGRTRTRRTRAAGPAPRPGSRRADHAPEAEVARGCVDRLALASGGAVAQAVVRGAQVRAALDDVAGDAREGRPMAPV